MLRPNLLDHCSAVYDCRHQEWIFAEVPDCSNRVTIASATGAGYLVGSSGCYPLSRDPDASHLMADKDSNMASGSELRCEVIDPKEPHAHGKIGRQVNNIKDYKRDHIVR